MKKVIKLKESDLELIVNKVISESLGVPQGILDTSENLYQDFVKELTKNTYDTSDEEYEIKFDVNYQIGDLSITSINVILDINKWKDPSKDEYQVIGYATPFESQAQDSSGKLKIVSDFDEVVIKIKFVVPVNWDFSELINKITSEKNEIIKSFSHELMHVYDSHKTGYDVASERAGYRAYQKISFGIKPIDKFLHLLYFTTAVENIVRPTELAMAIKLGEVSQKDFLKFLMDDATYKMLDDARKFSYENLRDELKKYINQIDEVGKNMNHHMGDTNEEKIDEILRLVYVNLINEKGDAYRDLMTSDFLERILGLQGEKLKKFVKFIRKIQRFKNTEDFFRNEEKLFKFVANNMIKKISKLYAMTKSENSSIKEWDLYHEVNKTKENLVSEIKFKI
jgi:hypothetical protein